ncbi:TssN family type VI secretion system protein [Pricia sp. S334]|uniref:TssN family type VI secretion system protein n=1 Tax=Pricia mediterranea TaxID=3076079 RepID=A0ABU3LAC7_9FLAO|nr:TssN family type VI secretion system protein [Pricia sp. S334]MDT7830632.1 TssN family type VI secretion system protein [Pricia sp. S334]
MSTNYFAKYIGFETLVPLMATLSVVFVALRLMASNTPGFKKQQKKFYFYLLIQLAVMAFMAAIAYNLRQSTVIFRHITLLGCALIMGALHVYFFQIAFTRFDDHNRFKEIVFSVITSIILIVPVIVISSYFEDLEFLLYYILIMAAFVLPTSFFILFNYAISIPVKLYSQWYYPLGNKYDIPKHYELKNMMVLNFMFHKNTKEAHMTSFKAKAPKDMAFGRLFFFFINDYNDKKATKIEMTEDSGNPYGWYFYIKPKWYAASKHIDSELSVVKNNLQDGDVVICQRI